MSKYNNLKNKDLTATFGNTMLSVVCKVFNHKYKHKRKITNTIHELKCSRCGKEFGINTSAKSLLPLDEELKELHNSFENYR
jgi:hypothetical protein